VDNAGSVHFDPVPGGTKVRVSLQYNPPAGALGAAVAKLFGQDPKKQVSADLQRFKELMELGLITTKPTQKPRHSEPEMKKEKLWDRDQVMAASEESFPASDPPSFTPERV
jgi:hypothetical protein